MIKWFGSFEIGPFSDSICCSATLLKLCFPSSRTLASRAIYKEDFEAPVSFHMT